MLGALLVTYKNAAKGLSFDKFCTFAFANRNKISLKCILSIT